MHAPMIVLLGAGHANIQALRMLAMQRSVDFQPTVMLISDSSEAVYSGMLPGHMMGLYQREELCFPLWNLCVQAGASFVCDEAIRIDTARRVVEFTSARPPVYYDILSVNCGIASSVPEGSAEILALKPISKLIEQWHELLQRLEDQTLKPQNFVIVGGGAAGVETAVALRQRLTLMRRSNDSVRLVSSTPHLINAAVNQSYLRRTLAAQRIDVLTGMRVEELQKNVVRLGDGRTLECDLVIMATTSEPSRVLMQSDVTKSKDGSMLVHHTLQSVSHPEIFGAGDCVSIADQRPLPKAGVFAVRQGRTLGQNLIRYAKAQSLRRYRAQRRFLQLVYTSPDDVVATWGLWSWRAGWMRRLKDQIDRSFMQGFSTLNVDAMDEVSNAPQPTNTCGGCGSKLSERLLSQVIDDLRASGFAQQMSASREDCAKLPTVGEWVTVDALKSMLPDPYLFGTIATLHALSDLWVSGISPQAITVVLGVAQKPGERMRATQMMAGILQTCKRYGLVMSNAHSMSTTEDQIAITAVGRMSARRVLRKSGAKVGDLIVLSKPLGTGIALQGLMQARINPQELNEVLASMLQANQLPESLIDVIHAATDVTGFGLIGHLRELLQASGVSARLNQIPMFAGTERLLNLGVRSFLIDENRAVHQRFVTGTVPDVVWDPQTNGPILLTISAEHRDLLPAAWHVIGEVKELVPHTLIQFP
jgi:selenide,water dikinase